MEDLVFGDGSLLSQQFPILGKDLEIPFLSLKDTGRGGVVPVPLIFWTLAEICKALQSCLQHLFRPDEF